MRVKDGAGGYTGNVGAEIALSMKRRPITPAAIFVLCACALALAAQSVGASPDQRARINLDGAWQTAIITRPADAEAIPMSGWADIMAPETVYQPPDGGPRYNWYRRDVTVPASWADRRIFVDFRGARYAPELFVDGKLAGSQFDGFTPFRCEITALAQPGETCHIALRCSDLSALFTPGYTPGPGVSDQASLLAPAGGYKNFLGIWDHVWLESTPDQRIADEDTVVTTSTRQGTISVAGTIDGAVPADTVGITVLDGYKAVLRLAAVSVGSDGRWSAASPFPNAHDWSPWNPHLYTLRIDLAGPDLSAIDETTQEFGFKEIWTEGPDIYLNGAKIHFLASATWPLGNPEPDSSIDAKVRAIRDSNTIAFRLHNQIWPEEWLNAADRVGLLIVDESPNYTDGDGMYAYNDPRFWQNYRTEIADMIRRDRNHASLAIWSIENEDLFMGNQKYDADLPNQLGDVGRFAKSIDPAHLITFEADQDPGGAADVMGLHYPHEMPDNYAYPNTGYWLGAQTTTEAAGGLLGKRSTSFYWDRKKPLYIGEYLWIPQNDYSDGSVYFGDDSYLNRDRYYALAKRKAFYDQTVAYRVSGVSGTSPWTVFGFGGVIEDPADVANEKVYYSPLAAFPSDRGFRYFGGSRVQLHFDVFNDSGRPHKLKISLRNRTGKLVGQWSNQSKPGDYFPVVLSFEAPIVRFETAANMTASLSADGKPVYTSPLTLRFFRRTTLTAPKGVRLIAYDPSGQWPNSVKSLAALAKCNPARTVVLVAPNALGTLDPSLPTITTSDIADALHDFLMRGGRAVVLEQQTLAPLGLGLDLIDHASTMTFPLNPEHPILAGIKPGDLSDWADDNYVTQREVRRPTAGPMKAVTVSGGPDAVGQSPIVEGRVGKGLIVIIQALVGEKRSIEPAAQQILQNSINYAAAAKPSVARPAVVIGGGSAFAGALSGLSVSNSASRAGAGDASLILCGGGPDVTAASGRISATLRSGGTVYWHDPDPGAFAAISPALGSLGVREVVSERGTSLLLRDSPLLTGVAREDLIYQITTSGWNQSSVPDVHASRCQFIGRPINPTDITPIDLSKAVLTSAVLSPTGLTLQSTGVADFVVRAAAAGQYPLYITAVAGRSDTSALIRVDVSGIQSSWLPVPGVVSGPALDLVPLIAGSNHVTLTVQNAGDSDTCQIAAIALGSEAQYPSGAQILAAPGALVAWKHGGGLVVLDGTEWDSNANNTLRGARFASALLSDVGFGFASAAAGSSSQSIPLSAFSLNGVSPYFSQTNDRISFYNDGDVETKVRFAQSGRYDFRVYGYSSPFHGVYALAQVSIDGKSVGDVELKSATAQWFEIDSIPVVTGEHSIGFSFINDQSDATEDRNMFVQGFAVAAAAGNQ